MNRTALITGASGGIGSAIAIKFAQAGYNVAICYNQNSANAHAIDQKIKAMGTKSITIQADVSRHSQVKAIFERIDKELGGVDILVNNAGISQIKMINDVTPQEWDEMFAVNTKSAYLCSKEALPHMVGQKFGRIINISSMWGIIGASCEVAYSSSKAALIGFTKALAKELAPSGITVNCICPGLIDTPMNSHLSKEDLADFIDDIPVMRMGNPYEIAHAAAFFAHEDSGYITSQILAVDGGIT